MAKPWRILGAWLLLCGWAVAQDTASIRGTIVDRVNYLVDSVNYRPLRGVHLRLELMAKPGLDGPVYGAITDDAGRFSVTGLRAGSYVINPALTGYVYVRGSQPDSPKSPVVEVKAGQQVDGLRIEMAAEAELSGHVFDESGEPLPDIELRVNSPEGSFRSGWRETWFAHSDDRGEFHIAVAPGKYVVKAEPPPGDSDAQEEVRTDGTSEITYRPVYYSNAPDPMRATVIEVAAGAERSGLDFHLSRTSVLKISGTISGAPADCPIDLILQVDYRDGDSMYDQPVGVGREGKFSISHLAPATYRLYAGCESGSHWLRSQMLEVTLENSSAVVELALAPGRELTGTATTAGVAGRTVHLESAASTRGHGPGGEDAVAADGTFQLSGIQPDRYRVLLAPQSGSEYLTVTLDDAPASHNVVDLRTGGAKLKITVGKAGSIAGIVEDHPHSRVFLYPDGDYEREAMRSASTEDDGGFHFDSLPPGKYRLAAWNAGLGWQMDPADAARKAEPVEVKAGETATAKVQVATKETADAKQ